MLPVSLRFVANPANPDCTTTPADRKAVSPLEYHREKSKNSLNEFFIALSDNNLEAIKKIYKEIGNELDTVGYLLRWDSDNAITHSKKINPSIDEESLEQLKDTAYAPMAKYLVLWRKHDKPLDDPLARWQLLSILDEAEKTGANPDCISLIRDRCSPFELDPVIMHHKEKSLGNLNHLLWSILNC